MRKAMFALPLLLAVALLAQSKSPLSQQVVVRNVTLNGITRLSASEQQEIIGRLQKSYGIISFGHSDNNLREALQDHGFYKASVAVPTVTVVSGRVNLKLCLSCGVVGCRNGNGLPVSA